MQQKKKDKHGESKGGVGSFCKHKTKMKIMNKKGGTIITKMKTNRTHRKEGRAKSLCKHTMKNTMNKKGGRQGGLRNTR